MPSPTPSTMKAIYRDRYGGPDVLEIKEVPVPTPSAHEVLVKVHTTTVNRTDSGVLRGKPYVFRAFSGFPRPKSRITGTDFAGEVVAVGPHVTAYQVGDRVMGLNDNGTAASQAAYTLGGGNNAITKIPEGIDYVTAVAGLEGGHYAYNFINKLQITPGERVMVNGGTGAIGSAAIQLLKHIGLHVVATCRTPHMEQVKALGADRVIDYLREDFTDDDEQFDYVFDAVGKSTFPACKRLLHNKGVYISSELGPGWQNLLLAMIAPLSTGKRVLFPLPKDIPSSLTLLRTLLQAGTFNPLIDSVRPFEEAVDAYRYMLSGEKVGSIVLNFEHA